MELVSGIQGVAELKREINEAYYLISKGVRPMALAKSGPLLSAPDYKNISKSAYDDIINNRKSIPYMDALRDNIEGKYFTGGSIIHPILFTEERSIYKDTYYYIYLAATKEIVDVFKWIRKQFPDKNMLSKEDESIFDILMGLLYGYSPLAIKSYITQGSEAPRDS